MKETQQRYTEEEHWEKKKNLTTITFNSSSTLLPSISSQSLPTKPVFLPIKTHLQQNKKKKQPPYTEII